MNTNRWLYLLLATALVACSENPGGIEVPAVSRVEVGPSGRVLTVGDTMRLTARPTTEDGVVLGSVAITWDSDDDGVATIRPNGIWGVVEAKAPGTARISASADGRTGSVVVTVTAAPLEVATVEIVPASLTLMPGQDHPVEAVLRTADGTVIGGREITWTTSSAPVVSVTSVGNVSFAMLRGQSAGTATITATSGGVQGVANVTVAAQPPAVHSITLAPADTTLDIGQQFNMRAVLRAADGSVITGRAIQWSSTGAEYASVDQHGNVKAHAGGNVSIRATAQGVIGQAAVRVRPAQVPVAMVVIMPVARTLFVDHLASYAETTRALAANGLPLEGRTITWSVSDTTIAAVNTATGQVRGRRPGVVKVRATSEGKTGEAELHVLPVPVGSVVYDLTYNWWDGQVRIAEPMGAVAWTDAQGVERWADLSLFAGRLTLDHGVYPHTYERVLIGRAYAHVNGVLTLVAEREVVDRGTALVTGAPSGDTYLEYTSTTTPGATFRTFARGHGELRMLGDIGAGRVADVLFRQRP